MVSKEDMKGCLSIVQHYDRYENNIASYSFVKVILNSLPIPEDLHLEILGMIFYLSEDTIESDDYDIDVNIDSNYETYYLHEDMNFYVDNYSNCDKENEDDYDD